MTYSSVFASGPFSDLRILVTGGGSGIRRCIAHEPCASGAHVLVVGRTQAKLDAVQVAARRRRFNGRCARGAGPTQGNPVKLPRSPFRFAGHDVGPRHTGARRGAGYAAVLTVKLGLSEDEIDCLRTSGVLCAGEDER